MNVMKDLNLLNMEHVKKNIKYLPTWHPSAVLRDENKKIDFIRDLLLVYMESQKI